MGLAWSGSSHPHSEVHGYETGGSVVELIVDDTPFLVDSVTAEIQDRGIRPPTGIAPGHRGRSAMTAGPTHRSYQRPQGPTKGISPALRAGPHPRRMTRRPICVAALRDVLTDIQAVVRDFEPMTRAVDRMVGVAEAGQARYPVEEIYETTAFLRWLLDGNFVFLGFRGVPDQRKRLRTSAVGRSRVRPGNPRRPQRIGIRRAQAHERAARKPAADGMKRAGCS